MNRKIEYISEINMRGKRTVRIIKDALCTLVTSNMSEDDNQMTTTTASTRESKPMGLLSSVQHHSYGYFGIMKAGIILYYRNTISRK